jgi:hypothetical protein
MKKYWIAPDDSVIEGFTPSESSDWRKCSAREAKEAKQRYAVRQLLRWIKPGQGVTTVLTYRASNGMSRRLRVAIAVEGRVFNITHYVADACGFRFNDSEGSIVIGGCGMDMGFHVVYALGRALWPHGTPEPHSVRNGEPDSEGGYALNHLWL